MLEVHFDAKIDYSKYDQEVIRTIEAHTEGEYCRVALDCPELPGGTMIGKKHYLERHFDHLRTMLMFEPRGHHDMFGAFLYDEPVNPEADFGIFFMDGGGYLNMCGHCTIGAVTAILEGGLKEMKEPETEVVLEAPAGLIRTVATCKRGKVTGVTLTNVPAFVYKEDCEIEYNGKKKTASVNRLSMHSLYEKPKQNKESDTMSHLSDIEQVDTSEFMEETAPSFQKDEEDSL